MSSEFVTGKNYNTNRSSPARFIISHMLRHPLVMILLLIGAASNAGLAALVPIFVGQSFNVLTASNPLWSLGGFDRVFNSVMYPLDGALNFVALMAVAIILSQLSRGAVQLVRNFSSETFGQRIERDVRDELYASLLGKSMTFHDYHPVGEIMARVTNDVREMNLMMNPGLNLLVGSSMFLIVPVIFAPLIHPTLFLVPLAFVVCHLAVQYRFIRQMHPVAQRVRASFGQMNARLAEALDGLQVVKGAAQERAETERFDKLADQVRDYFVQQGRIEARYLSYLLLGLSFVLGFAHTVILYQQGAILVGDIVNFMTLIVLFGFPVFTSLNSLSRVALGYASASRILEIINTKTDLDRNPQGHKATIAGEIVFDGVTFAYGEDHNDVLHDVSFRVKPGQTVAVVGQTGSGKSTVTKLINRTYDAQSGRVVLDGVDVREWDLESLRSQISIIEQDIFLFSRTIAENIAFGVDDATREQVIDAAQKAQAHDFILTFPEGYDTVIGQRGVTLSGGQRQRLAIARAFLTNPPVLILDDSTSAIDSATEDKIQQAIWSAARGRTTVLITHRLSQIRWADHIVVLRNGHIVAQGTHDDLLANSESYRRIFARYEADPVQQASEINGHDAEESDKLDTVNKMEGE
ncbi:MAG: ABC transporter ATP-binding protein [Anaerolineaceae bacterium]|nr:MAG: ABC transporter ATP-binding protein [Anaerolineaceae bacterium]